MNQKFFLFQTMNLKLALNTSNQGGNIKYFSLKEDKRNVCWDIEILILSFSP